MSNTPTNAELIAAADFILDHLDKAPTLRNALLSYKADLRDADRFEENVRKAHAEAIRVVGALGVPWGALGKYDQDKYRNFYKVVEAQVRNETQ